MQHSGGKQVGRNKRAWLRVVVGIVVCLLLSSTVLADSADERYLEGLRQRRLFRVAEAYCEAKLERPKLDEAERTRLTIEYMLTLAEHATHLPRSEREKCWNEARAAAEKFPAAHPRKLVIELQKALVILAQGELARQEAEAGSGDFALPQQLLREAVATLEELQRAIGEQIAARRDLLPEGALTKEELFGMQNNLRYQLARARRNQALCYPAGSDDRVASLGSALDELNKLRTQLADDEPLAWQVRLDQGSCERLREDYAAARQTLSLLIGSDAPDAIRQQAVAELSRVALAAGQPQAALKLLEQGRASAELTSAEREFALLETYVALWKSAEKSNNTQDAARYRDQATAHLAAIERAFGPYWARRGESLVIGSAASGEGNLDLLARAADARFVKGQFDDETVKAYDQASAMAQQSRQWKRYLELGVRGAVAEQRRGNRAAAAQRLLQLGETFRESAGEADQAQASAAHLQGVRWLAEAQTDPKTAMTASVEAYRRHASLWPDEPTADEAQLELGELLEREGRWAEAAEAYQQVRAAHPRLGEAVAGAARVWPRLLQAEEADDRRQHLAGQAIAYFRGIVAAEGEPFPETFTEPQRHAAQAAARLLLQYTKNGHAPAEALLAAAIKGSPDADDALRRGAEALRVVALAGQPARRDEAAQLIAQIGSDSPAHVLEMLQGLTDLTAGASADVRQDLARLQLQAIALVEPQRARLAAGQQLALARIKADALAASGQRDEALSAYEALVRAHPSSAALQQGYAELLAAGHDRASLVKGLDQWRIIAARSRPQTELWYKAKYEVARLNYVLGEKEQAAQLIRYLQATPPGLDDAPLRAEFLELLRKCQE